MGSRLTRIPVPARAPRPDTRPSGAPILRLSSGLRITAVAPDGDAAVSQRLQRDLAALGRALGAAGHQTGAGQSAAWDEEALPRDAADRFAHLRRSLDLTLRNISTTAETIMAASSLPRDADIARQTSLAVPLQRLRRQGSTVIALTPLPRRTVAALLQD